MKLGQIEWEGRVTAAVFEQGHALPIPGYTVRELVDDSEQEHVPFLEFVRRHTTKGHVDAK